MKTTLLLLAGLMLGVCARAQSGGVLYDDASLARVDVTIDPAYLAEIFAHPTSDDEFPATFRFERGDFTATFDSIGFRLRGNTSRFSRKQSFKVSFNTFVSGRKFEGVEKLNLNGEHNDPSLVRAKLSWDLFADAELPASRAAHVEVYVNDVYYGVYLNTEHLDEEFTRRVFGTDEGFLFKCLYPADLTVLGTQGSDYDRLVEGRPIYELKQGEPAEAFDRLAQFVLAVNQTSDGLFPQTIESIFDVNGFLKTLAVTVATGSWDTYWYLKNNYYLYYNPNTDLFHYLPYDFDNSFGVDFVDGDWATRDPYAWGHPSEARPLTERILAVPEFRARYTFYLRRLLERHFTTDKLDARIDALHALLTDAAERDTMRMLDYGYTIADFHASFDQAAGAHVEYGLKPFVALRRSTLLGQLDATNTPPIVHRPAISGTATAGAPLVVSVRVEDEAALQHATLEWTTSAGTQFIDLHDDGLDGDAAAADEIYTVRITAPTTAQRVRYRIVTTDTEGQVSTSTRRSLDIAEALARSVVVNEFMASNETTIQDESGAFEDWIELYNASAEPVRLLGYTLTDNLNRPDKWALPDTTLAPGGFLLVWADEDGDDGPLHADIKLSKGGEEIGLFKGGIPVDTLRFGPQTDDVSTGRFPDGMGEFISTTRPTPGTANAGGLAAQPDQATAPAVTLLPNPFTDRLVLDVGVDAQASIFVYDTLGRLVQRAEGVGPRISLTIPDAAAGLYLVRVEIETGGITTHTTRHAIRL